MDFKKAFDSVEFSGIWQALKECEVEEPHIELLSRLYEDQKGIVRFQGKSDDFPIKR